MKEGRIAVVGSNSFSGSRFVAHCLREGYEVLGLSRSPEPHVAFLPYRWSPGLDAGFTFSQTDLNHDAAGAAARIAEFGAPTVVNFAAQGMVAESWLHPDHWYATNVLANVRFHDALRKWDGLRSYLHVSTPEVYGSCSGDVLETAPFNPSTPYAASRAACELHLQTFFKQYGFPLVLTRAANVFGPGQQLYRIVPKTILCALAGKKLPLHGGGHSVRSFIDIGDVADGTLKAALGGTRGQAYHFSTRRTISIRDLVALICERMGSRFEDVAEIVGDRPGKDAAYLLDSSKARAELGWEDRITLEQGIDETVAWVKTHFDALRTMPWEYQHKP